MLKKIITIILTLSGTLVFGLPEDIPDDVPEGVVEIMREIETNPDFHYGLNHYQSYEWVDKDIKISDISVGLPIEEYSFNSKLETGSLDAEISEVIISKNTCRIPVFYGEKIIFHVDVYNDNGNWVAIGGGKGGYDDIWKTLKENFSNWKSKRPLYVDILGQRHLYFPDIKNSRNIIYIDAYEKSPYERVEKSISTQAGSKKKAKFIHSSDVIKKGKELILEHRKEKKRLERQRKRYQERMKDSKGGNNE